MGKWERKVWGKGEGSVGKRRGVWEVGKTTLGRGKVVVGRRRG